VLLTQQFALSVAAQLGRLFFSFSRAPFLQEKIFCSHKMLQVLQAGISLEQA
jgi:hypothetical protein